MEGNVYKASWSKKGKEFELWLKEHPHIRVNSGSFYGAQDLLYETILHDLGDGEAVVQYDKALPNSILPNEYASPEIVMLGANEWAHYELRGEMFDGGLCSSCKGAVGNRTELKAMFKSLPTKADSAVAQYLGTIFSEEFIHLLTSEEISKLQIQEVLCNSSKRKFFEIKGPFSAVVVGVKNFPGLNYGICKTCKVQSIYYKPTIQSFFQFVAKSDLKGSIPPAFVIANHTGPSLCMLGKRWREMEGKKGTRNIIAMQLGIVDDDLVCRAPKK